MSVSIPTRNCPPIHEVSSPTPRVSLRKNISWTMLGNVVFMASQWGVVIVLARLGSPEAVGRLALGLAVTAPIMMFCNLQLRTVQATDARRIYEFGDYLGLRLISTVAAFVSIYLATFAGGYIGEIRSIIIWLFVAKVIESFIDLLHGTLHRRESMDRIAQSLIARGVLSFAVFAVVYWWTQSTTAATASLAASWLFVLVVIDIPSAWPGICLEGGRIRPRFSPAILSRLLWTSLPAGLVTTLTSVETNLPRYVLKWSAGERELGIFASLAYLVLAQGTLILAVNQSAMPRLARLEASGEHQAVRRLVGQLVAVGAGMGTATFLACAIAGGPILTLIYGVEYREFTGAFLWVAAAAAVRFAAHPFAVVLRAGQQFWVLFGIHVICAGAMLAASLWLVPTQGINGAACSLFLSSLVFASLQLGLVALRTRQQIIADGRA